LTHSDLGDDLEVRYHHMDMDRIEGAWENLYKPDSVQKISHKEAFDILLGGNPSTGEPRTGAYKNLEILFNWIKDSFYVFNLNPTDKNND
jgi:hypothetical protein